MTKFLHGENHGDLIVQVKEMCNKKRMIYFKKQGFALKIKKIKLTDSRLKWILQKRYDPVVLIKTVLRMTHKFFESMVLTLLFKKNRYKCSNI